VEVKKIMMKQKYLIGVDISKKKGDSALITDGLSVLSEKVVQNTDVKWERYLMTVLKKNKIARENLLVCCENTGIYSNPLKRVCHKLGIALWVEHALKIKRASTDMRGKTDRQDALRIAEYACRYRDKAVIYQPEKPLVRALQHQVKIRETLIEKKVAMENQLREAKSHDPELYKALVKGYRTVLKTINAAIKKAEAEIEGLAAQDEEISTNEALLRSIPGIGAQTALRFIIRTDNFRNFSSAKHLACYAGVVPFANESGTIIKRQRISKMADKNLKQLLHMAAMAAIRSKGELQDYYKRKVAEGKNKMSVLNAVRNKLVHRIFAVILRQTPYQRENYFSIKNEISLAC